VSSSIPGHLDGSGDGSVPEAVSGETLLAVDVENLELQRRTLDMAIKVRGLYAADRLVFPDKHGDPQDLGGLTNIDMAARLLFLLDKARRAKELQAKELHDSGGEDQ
jgi:hypothetical protein